MHKNKQGNVLLLLTMTVDTSDAPALILFADVQKTLCNSINIPLNESCCIKLAPNFMFVASSAMQQLLFSEMFTELYNIILASVKSIRAGACTV
jgi:hypothetical protein